jgi:protoporphyrinogen oxidase
MEQTSDVGIIGGGILGISLGYFLSQKGAQVTIYEASPVLGGLAGGITLEDGVVVDRFYHAILSSDRHLRELCRQLGIEDRLRFKTTRMGFYFQNSIYSMNNMLEFLRFPPLGWVDRFRLGLTVLYAQYVRNWRSLESVSVERWLVQLSGRNTYQNIWRPMLRAKFDGGFERTPATYIWSRLVRMKSTRGGANQKEEAGYLKGGYPTLLQAMAERIRAAGGRIHLRQPVDEIVIEGGRATGVRLGQDLRRHEVVIATLQTPIFQRLIPGAPAEYRQFLSKTEYLGIIAALLVLDRPLTGYWTLNITDERIPFTGVIETTSYIDPQDVGGHHLVYLPKYTAPGSEWQRKSDDEIKAVWLEHLQAMIPTFDPASVRYFLVHRERYVEPLHCLNETDLIPAVRTPVENLFLATTAQIYPQLTNGESVTRFAQEVAGKVLPL